MTRHLTSRVLLLLASFASFIPLPSMATTYVMVQDPVLVHQAPVIVEVTIDAVASPQLPGRTVTDYQMSIDHVLKGFVPASSIIVRVAGGHSADGSELILHGAPRFREGGRALLFLKAHDDGTFGILHFLLGAFHVVSGPTGEVVLRSLDEAQEVSLDGLAVAPTRIVRNLSTFRAWIEDREAGIERAPDYMVELPEDQMAALADAFTLIEVAGLPVRWRAFDGGGRVTYRMHSDGQPGLADKGELAFKGALRAWTQAPGTAIDLVYGGLTTRAGGLSNKDNANTILFDDPNNNSVFEEPFSCITGGVIAAGGPWASPSSRTTWKGASYREVSEGDVVTNKGIACWIDRNARAAEVFAHELGHTLGLSHSCDPDAGDPCNTNDKRQALMHPTAHGDGRGAELRTDDLAAICLLYSASGDCSDPGTGGGSAPEAPTNLVATARSATEIQLSWQDNADDETQFQVERGTGGSFTRIATLGANTTSYLDTGLFGNTTYLYRVRSRNDAAASAWSVIATVNTPSAEPPPAAPSQLTAEILSSSRARLTWKDNADNETGHEVQASKGGSFSTAVTVPTGVTSAILTGLDPYTQYTFRIRAVGVGGASSFSNEAAALTHPVDTSTPATPSGLVAIPQSPTEILLSWIDNADNELGHQVDIIGPEGASATGSVEVIPGQESSATLLSGLQAGSQYTFQVRAQGVNDLSIAAETSATITAAGSTCISTGDVDCQLGSRFKVEVQWRNQRNGQHGKGGAAALTDRSSTFYFFDSANTELIVKTLDGTANNGNYWVFYGALTDVEYWLTVSDTVTGAISSYYNPPFNICGGADTHAIAAASSAFTVPSAPPLTVQAAADGTACGGSSGDLCLLDDRFRVEVAWTKLNGERGNGTAIPDSNRTGYFWFFNSANTELVVKMLDGRANNGKFWFFYGALSNVRYEISVTDTLTGAVQTYVNEQGNVCGQADINAF